jgi:hypothetical protein
MRMEQLVNIVSSTLFHESNNEARVSGFSKLKSYIVVLDVVSTEKLIGNSRIRNRNYVIENELLQSQPRERTTLVIDAISSKIAEKEAKNSELEKIARRLVLDKIKLLSEDPLQCVLD